MDPFLLEQVCTRLHVKWFHVCYNQICKMCVKLAIELTYSKVKLSSCMFLYLMIHVHDFKGCVCVCVRERQRERTFYSKVYSKEWRNQKEGRNPKPVFLGGFVAMEMDSEHLGESPNQADCAYLHFCIVWGLIKTLIFSWGSF